MLDGRGSGCSGVVQIGGFAAFDLYQTRSCALRELYQTGEVTLPIPRHRG